LGARAGGGAVLDRGDDAAFETVARRKRAGVAAARRAASRAASGFADGQTLARRALNRSTPNPRAGIDRKPAARAMCALSRVPPLQRDDPSSMSLPFPSHAAIRGVIRIAATLFALVAAIFLQSRAEAVEAYKL